MNNKLFGSINWLVTGVACLCVGLGAMGFDVLGMLHLGGVELYVRYVVGLAGALSLFSFVSMHMNKKCSECGCESSSC